MARLAWITLLSLLGALCLSCTPTMTRPSSEPELLRVGYASQVTGKQREYLVYLPRGYHDDPDRRWPLLVFLHGSGEVGDGRTRLDYVLLHGPLGEAWVQKRDLPFIMIGPQLPVFDSPWRLAWSDGVPAPRRLEHGVPPRPSDERPEGPLDSTGGQTRHGPLQARLDDGWWKLQDEVLDMVDTVLRDYRGDESRVYLTGISLGGWGVFELAAAHPDRWAAVAPVAGAGDPAAANLFAERPLPIWMFAGGRDDAVPLGWVTEIAEAINSAGHPSLRYTIHQEAGHLVWIQVYAGQDLYDWFLQHRRH